MAVEPHVNDLLSSSTSIDTFLKGLSFFKEGGRNFDINYRGKVDSPSAPEKGYQSGPMHQVP